MATLTKLKDIYESYLLRPHIRRSELASLEKQLNKVKEQSESKIEICVSMCNTIMTDISQLVSSEFPNDRSLGTYAGVINNMIKTRPLEPISNFLIYVYKDDNYRNNILAGNDNFFLSNNHSKVLNGDQQKANMMFQFKTCWNEMTPTLQSYIKQSMMTLVRIAEQYILSKGAIMDINDMLSTMVSKVKISH